MNNKNVKKVHFSNLCIIIGIFLFLIIIARLVFLNLSTEIDGINLKKFADNRNTSKEVLEATRGVIYDKSGEILAQTIDSYTVIAYLDKSRSKNQKTPKHVVNKEETAEKLSTVIKMDKEKILEILNQKGLYQVEFGNAGRGLTELQKEKILALNLPGIDFITSSKRYYPNLDFASYTLGYVQVDEKNKMVGEMGIEKQYNEDLTGTNGSIEYQKDANGYRIAGLPEIKIDKLDGVNVYLTIDSNIQLMVERVLNKIMADNAAKSCLLVVAEAKTGKVVAASSKPSFDPNIKNIKNYLNPIVSISFEPGSTMKTYSYMAAIDKGVYDGNKTYMSGTMEIDEYTIKDWNTWGWGEVSYDYGYLQSSNIGATKMRQEYLTKNELMDMYKKLGFGKKTGIELPDESSGEMKFKYEIEIANATFGQGLRTTPIQHIKALTSISNDGYILNPTIIDKIVDPNTNKVIYSSKKQKGTQIIKQSTVDKVKELMSSVVNNEDGTGHIYYMDGYDIIGKTGTAQVVNPNTGQYYRSTEASIKSFEGMYPKNDPKYVFYIAVENAPGNPMPEAIKTLITDIETYYNLAAKKNNLNTIYKLDNFLNKKTDYARTTLDSKLVSYVVIGNGDKIINQYPLKNTIVNGKVILITNDKNYEIPDIRGYSSKEIKQLASMLNITLNMQGTGFVTDFNVEKDESGKTVKINAILDQKYKDVIGE